jgi:hypothetical protein
MDQTGQLNRNERRSETGVRFDLLYRGVLWTYAARLERNVCAHE